MPEKEFIVWEGGDETEAPTPEQVEFQRATPFPNNPETEAEEI